MIPFNKPYSPSRSLEAVREVLASDLLQGAGPRSKKVESILSAICGGGTVLLTASCTQALEFAAALIGLEPGDEVILPSYTFPSAAASLANIGVVPVFVDVDVQSLNINVDLIRSAITAKTRAISVVNYGGLGCDFTALRSIADQHGLKIIEDNAHGIFSSFEGIPLGGFGDVATLSFHATKNLQCGEGGALIINDKSLLEKAFIMQEKGTNRKQFLAGEIQKYGWVDKGGSYLLPEILSALLLEQLADSRYIQDTRRNVWERYSNELFEIASERKWRIIQRLPKMEISYHNFWIIFPDGVRENFIKYCKENGIQANAHYQSLHNSVAGLRYGRFHGACGVSDQATANLVRLPLWVGIKQEEIDKIVSVVKSIK